MTPCVMCESTGTGRGWTYAGTMTFSGRVHEQCLKLYWEMTNLIWDLYHNDDDKIIGPVSETEFKGFGPVLEGLDVPRDAGGWDHSHPGFKIWMHGISNMASIFSAKMEAAKHHQTAGGRQRPSKSGPRP